MKIALLTRNLDDKPTNGFERYAHNLCNGLTSYGAEVVLINQDPPMAVRPSGSLISPPYYDLFLPTMRLLEGKARADVYHALTDSQALMFPFLRGKKVVTIHHIDLTPPGSPSEDIFRRFYGLGTDMAIKYADHFICISSQTKKELMEHYTVPEEMITIVPQAIPSKFRPAPKTGKAIGYLGALKKRKNVEFIIKAYSILQKRHPMPECKLLICGEGPDEERLRALVGELGIETLVEFKGVIPEDAILDCYNSFTLFAFPSLQEGFGFPILEAQACGVPVLTLKGAMVPEEVVKSATPCTDEGDMADRFYDLLIDDALRQKKINEGIEYAATFSIENMVVRTMQVYEMVLGR